MNLLLLFIILQTVNVIMQTVKSIATVKCGKTIASIVNAITFGLYTIVLVYMNCDLSLWSKVAITAITNFAGVWIVKFIEEKMRKDKLWLIQATFPLQYDNYLQDHADILGISYSSIALRDNKHIAYNFYCPTQKDSEKVKILVKKYKGKYFASESKIL